MKLKPLGDKILVQRLKAEEKTASGIYLPESAKEKPQHAKVVRVGTGKRTDSGEVLPFQVKEGDTVVLGKWGGTEVKVDGEEYVVLGEDEVLAVVG
ncbi:co-chaperone GroES [Phycisphaera mikurensis]|uniref:Co-chaperonin GroES n=1 Tax=Phycisphaera mikurensis (strain NBRC 102666 / KCTC 22515 / FYK2301M01) TaxID=1142394 RepID=I0IJB2_PHYMF|nr:co-chaperone GroES [Phycisphaera mikurensis]MBB6441850.1 chaperonin GroES [Phycisphaera mikurensis]BAM05350.1 10 kDa chaperonin [Phycisphaera mikurensis NBRC 102666]